VDGRSGSFDDLERIFRPRAVAVVGASPRRLNYNRVFLLSLREMGFRGGLFAVNAQGESLEGFPTYSKVSDIPGPVDHVIVAVPAPAVKEVLADISAKGVRSVAVFTSGFAESGDPGGAAMEAEMRGWLRQQPFRLIGPNCMGIYCPEGRMAFRPDFPKEPGPIGYVSQSGGMTISGVLLAGARGLRFSKAVSYGNEADLGSAEILGHLSRDPTTSLVWLYIEGSRDGSDLLDAMKKTAEAKPLLVLKGGRTHSGGRAAASHTGALAGAWETWEGALRGIGALPVRDLEEMVDTSQALLWLPSSRGRRLCLVCVSGGLSVNYTDLAVRAGFDVPSLASGLVARLRKSIDLPGTSLNNPLDLAAGFFRPQAYLEIFGALDRSGEVDTVVLVIPLEYLYLPELWHPGASEIILQAFVEAAKKVERPLIVVMPHTAREERRQEFCRMFLDSRIPVYPDMRRALAALNLWDRQTNGRLREGDALRRHP
jgi:acyl-CoA synthetase (NDP forming)